MVFRLRCLSILVKPTSGAYLSRVGAERLGQRLACQLRSLQSLTMVGVKKLNEMRMNPRRGVVNNFSIVKINGYSGLAR